MNSVMNKTQLPEKRQRDKLKREIKLNNKKPKQTAQKTRKVKKILKSKIINYEN